MDQWRWGGLVVRDAAIDDLDTIVKLENDSFPEDRVSRRSFAYRLRAPERSVIAVTIDEALAGYVLIALRRGGGSARIFTIAVHPRFGRRGVGSSLLAAAEKFARRHNRHAVTLEVRYDNAPAIALYEKCGYRLIGEHEDYYADGATALRYRKVLDRRPQGGARSLRRSPAPKKALRLA
jgi:[ribosomal protein S18]-alanine N-acetyltransferase